MELGESAARACPADEAKIASALKMQIGFNVVLSHEKVDAARIQIVANTRSYRIGR